MYNDVPYSLALVRVMACTVNRAFICLSTCLAMMLWLSISEARTATACCSSHLWKHECANIFKGCLTASVLQSSAVFLKSLWLMSLNCQSLPQKVVLWNAGISFNT